MITFSRHGDTRKKFQAQTLEDDCALATGLPVDEFAKNARWKCQSKSEPVWQQKREFRQSMDKYRGKLTAEVSLFREVDHVIEKEIVFLGDRVYSSWFDMVRLIAHGSNVVVRKHQLRKSDFRTGIRNGKDDHSIRLDKPQRPD